MANDFSNNFTETVHRITLEHFQNERVISKTVNTQMLDGKFNPDTGDKALFKRPTDDVVIETPDGDISASSESPFITGTAFGQVQDYITVYKKVSEVDQSLKLGTDKERFFKAIARRMVTQLELNFAKFCFRNTGLLAGTVGTGVSKWGQIGEASALMDSTGVPSGDWYYILNPYSKISLSDERRSLGVNPEVSQGEKNILAKDMAGFTVMSANSLPKYATDTPADRTGALAATPDGTYVTAKDTMTQSLSLNGFAANLVIKAGEQIQVTGRNRLNLATREAVIDDTQQAVPFTATVVNEVTLDGTGSGTVTVTGPGIYEATGAYNTVDSALTSGDIVTLLGAEDKTLQPNLFYHRDAFSIGSVPMERLAATDTFGKTEDGIEMRVSMGSELLKNNNLMRFDIHPAYAAFNPFFAGQGYGNP